MNEIKLKPCPFCGGEAILIELKDCGYYAAKCKNECAGTRIFADKQKAAEAWNRRADNTNCAELPHLLLERLGLSIKPYNCLKRAGLNTLEDVVNKLGEGRTHIRNLGEEGAHEVVAKFKKYGVDIKIVKDSGHFCLELDRGDKND